MIWERLNDIFTYEVKEHPMGICKRKGRDKMSLINIDEGKCKRDGLCAIECPVQIIELRDKESFPTEVEGGEDFGA